jgi:hypothetical protein
MKNPLAVRLRQSSFYFLVALLPIGRSTMLAQTPSDSTTPGLVVLDAAGNLVGARGIALVDWDGYIANPAVKLTFSPTAEITRFPATVKLSAKEPRMYFDLPSSINADGPSKSITFRNAASKVVIYLSIFPDREGKDERASLQYKIVEAGGAARDGSINVHVFDQDENRPSTFKVTTDFSYDEAGFFKDPERRQIVQQAADDWAYFIDDMDLDLVPSFSEKVNIFPQSTDFSKSTLKPVPVSYKGFLVELYGVDLPELHSGGSASNQSFQTSRGVKLPLRRSGNVAIETKGNYNTLGWLPTIKDSEWWKADNLNEHPTDLYSIAHRQIELLLGFSPDYPKANSARNRGDMQSPELLAYHKKYPKVDSGNQLTGEIDDASLHGVFGNEYNGKIPEGRWIITKLEVLCLEAIGYKIRRPFDLSVKAEPLAAGHLQVPYTATLHGKGGLPWYGWSLESGALPDGLGLDADTGEITGQPAKAGSYTFTVRLTDSSEKKASVVSAPLTIIIH